MEGSPAGAALRLEPVLPRYPIGLRAIFEDARGLDEIVIVNDGRELRTVLRGVALAGPDFDALEVPPSVTPRRAPFQLDWFGALQAGTFTASLPVAVALDGVAARVALDARISLPPPIERVDLSLRLPDGREPIQGRRANEDFEAALDELVHELPPDVRLLTCHSCGLSDYCPGGHGLFGALACFRDAKAAYRSITTKRELIAMWSSRTEFVQETHVCAEWEARPPDRGVRG